MPCLIAPMRFAAMPLHVLVLCYLALIAQAQTPPGSLHWRFIFQYILKPGPASTKNVFDSWDWWSSHAPVAIDYAQFGVDLGLQNKYSSSSTTNSNFVGRIDFPTYANLQSFAAFLTANSSYSKMLASHVLRASCLQTISIYSTIYQGVFFRSSMLYSWANLTTTVLANARANWIIWTQTSPVKPFSVFVGDDLGLGPTLFPDSPPNAHFACSLTFSSQSDLEQFHAWVASQPMYKSLLSGVEKVSQIQWRVTFSSRLSNATRRSVRSKRAFRFL